MKNGVPSRTAYRVALRRAAHQVVDRPLVFPDPLALRILGPGPDGVSPGGGAGELRAPNRPGSRSLRALLVARSRWAEDALHAAVLRGVRQYVVLGAGLDTFAYRNPYPELSVFEVDHPLTQQWKHTLLAHAELRTPPNARHVPVDFECDDLAACLQAAHVRTTEPIVFAWLGVVAYLQRAAFDATLHTLSAAAPGSILLMDYGLPRDALPPVEQQEFDSLAARVAAAGEPFHTFFLPDTLHALLRHQGWHVVEDLDGAAINARYFAGRADGLHLRRSGTHLVAAELQRH